MSYLTFCASDKSEYVVTASSLTPGGFAYRKQRHRDDPSLAANTIPDYCLGVVNITEIVGNVYFLPVASEKVFHNYLTLSFY